MSTIRNMRNVSLILLTLTWALITMSCTVDKPTIIGNIGLSTPESVEYYAAEDVYLVTNINGSPFADDSNGFVTKLNPDGSVVDLKWIDGTEPDVTLHAPKGAAINGNHLYVADRNQVHVFALPGGKQTQSITIESSTFLNGVTPGNGDFVYVTDSGFDEGFTPSKTDAIYKVWANGKYETVLKDEALGHPNGILTDGDDLLTVTFVGTGEIIRVKPDGKLIPEATPPQGSLDGLVKLTDGRFAVSSWGGSAVYTFDTAGTITVLADSLKSPADLGHDTKRKRVLVPLFQQNKVAFVPY